MLPDQSTMSETLRDGLRLEVEDVLLRYHILLDSLHENDLLRRSLNPAWSVGELLLHMVFCPRIVPPSVRMIRLINRAPKSYERGFVAVQDWFTPYFNWINARTSRIEGRHLTTAILGRKYDRAHEKMLGSLDRITDNEWQLGIPFHWDPAIGPYVTIEKLFHYPKIHFEHHLQQMPPG